MIHNKDDRWAAVAYIGALTGDESTPCTFQIFDDRGKDPSKAQILHGTIRQVGAQLIEANRQGCGIFTTVNATDLRGRKAENVVGVRALFCDFDGIQAPAYHLEPSIVVKSINGPHAYWLVDDCGLGDFRAAQKRLIAHYHSDPVIHDLNRVMRLPGFYHCKRDPQMVKLVSTPWHRGTFKVAEVLSGIAEVAENAPPSTWRPPRDGVVRGWRALDPVRVFREAGMYGRDLGSGKHAVICPWTHEHTVKDWEGKSGSTVIWETGTAGAAVFKCSHSHCGGRYMAAALSALCGG